MEDNWEDLIGRRALIKSYYFALDNTYVPQEVRFLELSPSGEWVKIQYLNVNRSAKWIETDKVEIIEVLED